MKVNKKRKITRRTAAYLCDVKKHNIEKHDNNWDKLQERIRTEAECWALSFVWRFAHNNALNWTGRSDCQKAAATPSSQLMRALCAVGLEIVNRRISEKN